MDLDLLHELAQPNTTKIVLCSLDGLGGLPRQGTGKSELETARLPNLHALAARAHQLDQMHQPPVDLRVGAIGCVLLEIVCLDNAPSVEGFG